MFGCHNCGMQPQKNEVYENTPCAQCRAGQDPAILSYYKRDPAVFQKLQVMHPAYEEEKTQQNTDDNIYYRKEDLFTALSQAIRVLLRMKEQNPETYRVIEAKMAEPLLSYSQLAEKLSCRKQNILYHLKKAVRLCPELSCALIIDTRRLNGHRSTKLQPRTMQ